MGATQASPSRADLAELTELRRRAYGPDADIAGDPDACARLLELESAQRPAWRAAVGAPDNGTDDIGTSVAVPAAEPDAVSRHDAVPLSDSGTLPTRVDMPPSKPAPRWWQGRAAILLDVGVAAVAIGILVSAFNPPSTDITLHPRADIPREAAAELAGAQELNYLGIAAEDVRLYDEFRGLNIWSGPRGSSSTCMFVTTDTRPRSRVDCAPWSGEPTIDLVKYRESSRLSGVEAWGDMPVGSMIRLIMRDGAVIAQTVEAPAVAAGPR
jgi:hypothetical protein